MNHFSGQRNTSMRPLVSICIPTYNRAALLERAIASAQKQSYPNIEIIVTDNCSTDETETVVQNIVKRDPRVQYFRNETNVGPTRNWQIAVSKAGGEFCKILFSDDEMAPDFVASCINQFNQGADIAFVFTDAIVGPSFDASSIPNSGRRAEGISDSKAFILQYLLCNEGVVSPSCALFRTADLISGIVTDNPLFESDVYAKNGAGPDSLTFLNAALAHAEIAYVDRPLTLFRTSADSISVTSWKTEESSIILCTGYAKARYQFLNKLTGQKEMLWYWRFLATMTGACRRSRARKLIAENFKLQNGRMLTTLDFIFGLFQRHFRNLLVKPKLRIILEQI